MCFGGGRKAHVHAMGGDRSMGRSVDSLKAACLPVPSAGGEVAYELHSGRYQTWKPRALPEPFWQSLKNFQASSLSEIEMGGDEKIERLGAHADALLRALHTIVSEELTCRRRSSYHSPSPRGPRRTV